MKMGNDIITEGAFSRLNFVQIVVNPKAFVQKACMKSYSEVFGDFIIHDGTHHVDRYGFVALVFTLIDSLGKSVMAAYSLAHSEHSDHILEALGKFRLDKGSGVSMTDQGSAFFLVANRISKTHLFCAKHYTSTLLSARVGENCVAILCPNRIQIFFWSG